MQTAKFWEKIDAARVRCHLCPHECVIADGKTGLCGIRKAENGELQAAGYGLLSSVNIDPIEKKPLYHFYPGTEIFSIGGWGCNFACAFCQNWTISQQVMLDSQRYSPDEVINKAIRANSTGIAYTYNEPLIAYEFVSDCARIAKQKGLANVLVTNGYINSGPANELLPLIDALNIDIKSMEDAFYRKQCRGTLKPVLDFTVQAVKAGCHVEVTNLLIPGLNDSDEVIEALAKWMKDNAGRAVPLHLSAYHPQYKLTNPPTSLELLKRAYDICKKELSYVYIGNVITSTGRDTLCLKCGSVLLERRGYDTRMRGITNSACGKCGERLEGFRFREV